MADLPPAGRLPLLILGMLSLVGGTLAGLARLAWEVPPLAAAQAGSHGALMISAFFGTVISLERAVALGRGWAYLGPAAAGLGGLGLLLGLPPPLPQALAIAAAAVLTAASLRVVARLPANFTVVLALGAACWLAGNGVWLAAGLPAAVPWWLAFLILTIAGERLELTRFLPTPPVARRVFALIAATLLAGAAASHVTANAGLAVFAAGLLALAGWLLRYDIARRNAGEKGLTRFIALCLLSGYGWLALAGLLGLFGTFVPGHPWRDAALHAVGVGFVFAMVFGHAPIIFPAVTKVRIPYSPAFYVPLAVLHLSLAWRIAGGLTGDFPWRHQGGLGNAVALVLFIATLLTAVVVGRQAASRR